MKEEDNRSESQTVEQPAQESSTAPAATNKLSQLAAFHGKDIFSAVLVGVLVTLISTFIVDRYFYNQDDRIGVLPPTGYQTPAPDTQADQRLYFIRSSLAQVLSAMTPAKMHVNEYYMTMGRFPQNADELRLSVMDLEEHSLITGSYLSPEGAIGVSLSAEFGDGRHLLLYPKASTNGAFIEWRCETNVDEKYLGNGPSSMCQHRANL